MTDLPGNRIPTEALPDAGANIPAAAADLPPVWCRHSIRWSWVPDTGGYECDDPDHGDGLPATTVGAIGHECQPTFAHPPNAAQRAALG